MTELRVPPIGSANADALADVGAFSQEQLIRKLSAELKETQEKLRESDMLHGALTELSNTTQSLTDSAQIMAAAARLLVEYLRVDRCAYAEVEDQSVYVITGDHSVSISSIVGRWDIAAFGTDHHRLMKSGEAFVVDDADADPRITAADLPAYRATGIRAVICVPLLKGGKLTAAMAVHQATPRRWTPTEIRLVAAITERCWDVLERARVERTLRQSESRYRAIVEATPECVKLVAPDGTLLQMNSAGLTALDADDSIVGKCLYDLIAPEFRERYQAFNERICSGERGILEFDIVGLKGRRRQMETIAVPLAAPSGGYSQLAVTRDVTQRTQAESDLEDIRSRMEAALTAGAIGTWTWDVQQDRFYGDESLARIFSVPLEAVAGGPIARLIQSIHPDDMPRIQQVMDAVVQAGGPYEADYRVTRGNGEWRWIAARGQVQLGPDGKATWFPGVVIDINARKHAEAALSIVRDESDRRKRLYETILGTTPDLVYVFDRNHRFVYANAVLLQMWGRTWDEAIGKNCLELGYEPWHAAMHDREIDQVIATKKPIRGEVPFAGTFGRRIYDYIFVPVIGIDGEVEAVAGTTRDITERQQMEADVRQADRRKDDFIALLAHELRNPLAPIRNGLHVMRLADADPATRASAWAMMDRQLSHMVRLIDDLLDISRINRNKMELRRSRVSLADVVSTAVETVQSAVDDADHELSITLPGSPVYLDADLTRLAQVISNLLSNSVKYTPAGGTISLTAAKRTDQLVLSVRDT